MKIKIKSIIIIALAIIVLGTIYVEAAESIKLSLNSIEEVNAGENITLKINCNNILEQESKVAGIKVDVFYDIDVFEFISAKKLDAASNTFDLYENYPEEGRIRIGVVSMMGLNKNGELYEVTLKSKDNITKSKVEVKLEAKEVVDSKDNDIPTITENSTIKFKNVTQEEKIEEEIIEEKTGIAEESQDVEVSAQNEKVNNIKISKKENKNIKALIEENITDINTDSNLTYRVNNPEILEIDSEGNIIIKETGITNIDVISEDETIKTIPVEIIDENVENQNNKKNNYNIIFFSIITIVIVAIVIIIIKKSFNKKK